MVEISSNSNRFVNSTLAADLAWDYTGDESSPLLRNAVAQIKKSDQKCVMTKRQMHYLLQNLQEVSQILNNELYRSFINVQNNNTANSNINNVNITSDYSQYSSFQENLKKIQFAIPYIPIIVIFLEIVSLLVDSLLDTTFIPHKPYTSAVVVSITTFLLIIFYVYFLKTFMENIHHIGIKSFCWLNISSILVFTSLYSIFYGFDNSSFNYGSDIIYKTDIYIVNYLKMLHLSIGVFSLFYYGQPSPVSWNVYIVLTIQMLVSYSNLVVWISLISTKIASICLEPKFLPSHGNNINERPNDNATETLLVPNIEFDDTDSIFFASGQQQLGTSISFQNFTDTAHNYPRSSSQNLVKFSQNFGVGSVPQSYGSLDTREVFLSPDLRNVFDLRERQNPLNQYNSQFNNVERVDSVGPVGNLL